MKVTKFLDGVTLEISTEDTLADILREWDRIEQMLHGVRPREVASLACLLDPRLVEEMQGKYLLSREVVLEKIEDLRGYCLANGKRYKNYKAALENFIRGDLKAGKIRKEVVKPKPDWQQDPEISDEQRAENIRVLAEMRKKHGL